MTLGAKKPKPRKCKACRGLFSPARPLQSACSLACSLEVGRKQNARAAERKAKEERKAIKAAKEKLKTRSDHVKEAQVAFNAFIRERDRDLPCVSCGRGDNEVVAQSVGGTWDCGHFRSVGSCPELRFEPLNAARQCKRCNRDLSGLAVDYRACLIKRIGLEKVEWLEGPHEPRRYTIEELQSIKAHYRKLVREMKREQA